MTSPPAPVAVQSSDELTTPRTGRRRRIWLLVFAVALAVPAAAWWATHPPPFSAVGATGDSSAQAKIDELITFGLFPLPDRGLTLRSARAVVVENSADATISVVLCMPRSSYTAITRSQ